MAPNVPPLSLKVVIRCRDYQSSHHFYAEVLKLPILEEWQEGEGQGCIFGFGEQGSQGQLEIYQMTPRNKRYKPEYDQQFSNDKIDIQLRTDSLDSWIKVLKDAWPYDGPHVLPWGQRWIKLRDPDHLLVAIYEELQ